MPEPLRFDEFSITLFLPRDTEDSVANAARAALDEPGFRESLTTIIRQHFATVRALSMLSVVVEM